MTAIIFVAERLIGKPLSKRSFVVVFIVVFSLAAFFMAWRDEYRRANGLHDLNIALQSKVEARDRQLATLAQTSGANSPSGTNQAEIVKANRREIQQKITGYMSEGNSLRNKVIPGVVLSQEQQQAWVVSVNGWHKSVEVYLKTIPRGDTYLARFRNQSRSNASYPGGGNTWEWYSRWDLLSSDLARLEEFLQDPELGAP